MIMSDHDDGDQWIALADLMLGCFLISLLLMFVLAANKANTKNIVIKNHNNKTEKPFSSRDIKQEIYVDLINNLKPLLTKGDISLDKDSLTVKFIGIKTIFNIGQAELPPEYQYILKIFFPKYIKVLMQHKYSAYIANIRVEGHSSQGWGKDTSPMQAYLNNMRLSQLRVYNVLYYINSLNLSPAENNFLLQHIIGTGFSSSHSIAKNEPTQRVEFKVYLIGDKQILQ